MRGWFALALICCATLTAQQAPIPTNDELSGRPLVIKNKWVIGGTGKWDYLTFDPISHQLFIAHQSVVQVVDTDSGAMAGEITGFGEAHAVVLDPDGQSGYATDGRANVVRVFDRRTYQILSSIDVGCSPRSIAFELQTRLLFAICGAVPAAPTPTRPRRAGGPTSTPARNHPPPAKGVSHVIVVDADAKSVLADIEAGGDFRVAQCDDSGQVYVTVAPAEESSKPPGIARLNATAIAAEAHREGNAPNRDQATGGPVHWQSDSSGFNRHVQFLWLDNNCANPQGLAIDSHTSRLFVACGNQTLQVLDAESGGRVATLTTGPGADSVAYDAGRHLIYTANGGGYGSITVIRQHVTDSYAVIQNLPTMQQARTMAIDPGSGELYLVTTLYGAKLDHPPMNGIGTLKLDPVDGSFQVMVIGN
jgi:DNA-binding beta-propeller fold protein YncE